MLWKLIKGQTGLSAGRIQSAAFKLIHDRDQVISRFQVEEYWSIKGLFFVSSEASFYGELTSIITHQVPIRTRSQVDGVLDLLRRSLFKVLTIDRVNVSYGPPATFITTTFLKAASSQLGFSPKKTMEVAQALFEGAGGSFQEGLITYMRTDSPRVDPEAADSAAVWIKEKYGQTTCEVMQKDTRPKRLLRMPTNAFD